MSFGECRQDKRALRGGRGGDDKVMTRVITGIVGAASKDKLQQDEIENPRSEQTTKAR